MAISVPPTFSDGILTVVQMAGIQLPNLIENVFFSPTDALRLITLGKTLRWRFACSKFFGGMFLRSIPVRSEENRIGQR